MKKSITALMLVAALTGCDEANKAIDKAQEAATKAVDSVQEQIESVDLSELNIESLQGATESAQELAESLKEAVDVDFTDTSALQEVSDQIANSYACLVDATSESTAEKMLNKFMAVIGNEESQSLIEKAIDKAKAAQECVM
ncbi:hypothetical protein [Enterovibrio paralichthyis]|uniref:hypothetical protein n=1 Tax=Enterovibrio paralichthyis TaxID=2853805 RepID=UPI001C48DA40|nr:hypothetical protein [Enterovibrio paralichthyis]MBV7296964.1 hypothetical protein [Enterovibrio paralichthyis]